MADDSRGQSGPSRTTRPRRARAGFGTGETEEIDGLILEVQTRKYNNDVLIPGFTELLLTTNSALAPSHSSTTQKSSLNERYFTRPEVIASYRAQAIIETPEFQRLEESNHGGARLRHKDSSGHVVDLSDAAFERRHRKYEGFEKRQRLREKESLKHQHYQLTQRIDKLKGLDPSVLLSIPSKYFSAPLEGDENEAERRREELLNSAEILSERYHLLLYPGRPKKRKATRPKAITSPTRPSLPTPQSPTALLDQSSTHPSLNPLSIVHGADIAEIHAPNSPRKKKLKLDRASPSRSMEDDVPNGDGAVRSSTTRARQTPKRPSSGIVIDIDNHDSADAQHEVARTMELRHPVAHSLTQFPLSPIRSTFQSPSLGPQDAHETTTQHKSYFLAQTSPAQPSCELEQAPTRMHYSDTPPEADPEQLEKNRPPSNSAETPSQPRSAVSVGEPSGPASTPLDLPSDETEPLQHLSYPPPPKITKDSAHDRQVADNKQSEPMAPLVHLHKSRDTPEVKLLAAQRGRPPAVVGRKKKEDEICPLVKMAMSKSNRRGRNAKPFGFALPVMKEEEFNLPGWPWGAEREGDTESQASISRAGSLALSQDPNVGKPQFTTIADEGSSDEEDQLIDD